VCRTRRTNRAETTHSGRDLNPRVRGSSPWRRTNLSRPYSCMAMRPWSFVRRTWGVYGRPCLRLRQWWDRLSRLGSGRWLGGGVADFGRPGRGGGVSGGIEGGVGQHEAGGGFGGGGDQFGQDAGVRVSGQHDAGVPQQRLDRATMAELACARLHATRCLPGYRGAPAGPGTGRQLRGVSPPPTTGSGTVRCHHQTPCGPSLRAARRQHLRWWAWWRS